MLTADRLELVRLSYEALERALSRAQEAVAVGDLAGEAEATGKAVAALAELAASLNYEEGGEIAQNLGALYGYMMNRLTQHMCSASSEAIDEALAIVRKLREAWDALGERAPAARMAA